MANLSIQIKRSLTTNTPNSLNIGEPAYSYASNTFFIGSPAGTGSIAVGGKFYLDQQQTIFNTVNAAFTAANNAVAGNVDQAARNQSNSAFIQANAAFAAANAGGSGTDQFARNTANAAFIQANTPSYVANSAASYANAAFAAANASTATNVTQNNSITAAFNTANAAFAAANAGSSGTDSYARNQANAAFVAANASTATDTTQNNSITVALNTANAAFASANNIDGINSTQNNSIAAAFAAANAASATDTTQNNSITAAFNTANAAFIQANTPSYVSNSAASYANAAFAAANAAFTQANVSVGVDASQNSSITAAFNTANAAFAAANAGGSSTDSWARNQANAAFIQANTTGTPVGNNISLGANGVGQLVSNAITLTTTTSVTNSIAQLNQVLGKLVPPGPPAFPSGNTLTISNVQTFRMTNFTQTDRTSSSRNVAGGTTVTNIRRSSSYSTSTIQDQGPGDSGTLTLFKNSANNSAYTFTNASANGTYGDIVISDSVDYGSKVTGTAQGFWRSFDSSAAGTVSNGWNEIYLTHSGASTTNTPFWYYDDNAPGAPVISSTSIVSNTVSYANSSTIPHYNSSTLFNLGFNVAKLSGDTYPTTDTFVSAASGGAFQSNAGVTYTQAGITTPLARNLYVTSGYATVNLTCAVTTGFGNSSSGPTVTTNNSYLSTTSAAITPGAIVQYKTGTSSAMEETTLTFGSAIGVGSGLAFRVANPDSGTANDNPSYANNASAFDSTNGPLRVTDATIVAGVLKHDITNYSTGYLPVGPNLSTGRSGSQYFTFKFIRTSVSKFDIQFSGTIAGLWVALPGSIIDSKSTIGGWLDMSVAYAGSGIPGVLGNGSNGCALGGIVTLNSLVSSHRKTCTFGTVSSSDTTLNEIYVRIKLTTGQTVTALSLQTASN